MTSINKSLGIFTLGLLLTSELLATSQLPDTLKPILSKKEYRLKSKQQGLISGIVAVSALGVLILDIAVDNQGPVEYNWRNPDYWDFGGDLTYSPVLSPLLFGTALILSKAASKNRKLAALAPDSPPVNTDFLTPVYPKETKQPDETAIEFKIRKNNKTGWSLLASGASLNLFGLMLYPANYSKNGNKDPNMRSEASFAKAFMYTGTGFIVSSIPFFISARQHRKKDPVALQPKIEKIISPARVFPKRSFPALSVRWKF